MGRDGDGGWNKGSGACLPAVEALARSHAHAQAEVLTVQQANEPEPSNVDHRIAVQLSPSPPAPPPPLSPSALLRHPHITASGTPGELDLTSSIHSRARLIAAAHHLSPGVARFSA